MSDRGPQWHEEGGDTGGEERFAAGFMDGFTRAREIFWRDFMRKAGECRLMAENSQSEPLKEQLYAMEVAYRNAADLASRSHTLYPGALPAGANPDDPRYTVKFNEDLYRY